MFRRHPAWLPWIVILLLLAGCAAPTEASPPTPEVPTPTKTAAPATPAPASRLQLPKEDQVMLGIPNLEPWSGKEGAPRPDWMGWGAEAFSAAADGTFWIADTAVTPNRLLHYDPQGALLKAISLEDRVVYAYDLLVTGEGIWILDISSQQPKAIQVSPEGETLVVVDLSAALAGAEAPVANFIYDLFPGGQGEPLLASLDGYFQIDAAAGGIVPLPGDALTYYGHTYRYGRYDEATGQVPIYVDGAALDLPGDFKAEIPILGFNPDGSFALAGSVQDEPQVIYMDAAGRVLWAALQYPQTFYKDTHHQLAFGPDGAVYQLLSNPDHSVQIVRLGFTATPAPRVLTPRASPTPLTPLALPASPATDEDQARVALITFFADLSAGNYAAAAARFGGAPGDLLRAPRPGEGPEDYWKAVCQQLWCLPAAGITGVERAAEDEYVFDVVFMQPDGTRFEIGACCGGDPAATPPVWQFAYPVRKVGGEWKVMQPPLFTP